MARLMDSPLYRGKNDAERLQSFKDRQINDASQTDVKDSLTSGAEAGSAGNLRIDDKNPFKGPQKGAMPHPDSTLDPLPPGSQGRPLAALDKENTKKVGRG